MTIPQWVSHCWILHFVCVITYTTIFAIALFSAKEKPQSTSAPLLQLPAQNSIHQEIQHFPTALRNNAFTGDPRPELDHAWHNLVRNDNIRVSSSDITRFNMTSIELADGSGVVAQLGVFHALHCLKMVRHWIHPDYYFADATEHARWKMGIHVDHCIEYIRENLMCHPDISLVTHRWVTTENGWRPSNKDTAPHECANWDALNKWAGNRAIDLYQLDQLKGPSADEMARKRRT